MIENLKKRMIEFLDAHPDLAYSMEELTKELGEERWLVQKAASQLYDENVVVLRVDKKFGLRPVVYAHLKKKEVKSTDENVV